MQVMGAGLPSVRPEKPLSVEVDEMTRGLSDPNLCLPGNLLKVAGHSPSAEERSDVDKRGSGVFKQIREFAVSLRIDGTVTGDSFNENKPVLVLIIDDDVRHLPVSIDFHPE